MSCNTFEWRRFTIIFAAIAVVYLVMTSLFLGYLLREKRESVRHNHMISACLQSGGHIRSGNTCWYPDSTTSPDCPLLTSRCRAEDATE
jgi:hypothetical protein